MNHDGVGQSEPESFVGFDSFGTVGIITIEEMDVIASGGEKGGVDGSALVDHAGLRGVMDTFYEGNAVSIGAKDWMTRVAEG